MEREREGVSREVNDKMNACDADVICSDGVLLRMCEHGIKHPVGHVHGYVLTDDQRAARHERHSPLAGTTAYASCCEARCCLRWADERVMHIVAVTQ